jgi:putative transposase
MACWRRTDHAGVVVHSNQGCQYTNYEWRSMLKTNGLKASKSRGGNCHDNACAESFFSLLKKERIRRRTCPTRETVKADVFNYIELFYNPTRRHVNNGDLSPMEFENNYFRNQAGI